MRDEDLVVMGYVRDAFGIRGWVKIHTDTMKLDGLFDYPVWWLGKNGQWKSYKVLDGGVQTKIVVAQLEGVADRNQAESMRGMSIAVERSALPQTEEDEYYWSDLVGLEVRNTSDEYLGKVANLLSTGAHDVLVVQDGGEERLIPFINQFVLKVDIAAQKMVVDWGLDY